MSTGEPEFVGVSRLALLEGLEALLDEVDRSAGPRWVSLEAPSGWGKTRVARELYSKLAARQPEPRYWPESIVRSLDAEDVTNRRKRVHPDVVHVPGSLPSYTWWGITCSTRHGVASVALAQDAAQLEAHAPYLEDAWLRLPRTSLLGRDAREFGAAVVDEVAMEFGGQVLESVLGAAVPGLGLVRWLGEWSWGKARAGIERRDRLAARQEIRADHSALADSLVEMLARLSRPGLPTVVFVEDLHDADALLLDVLRRLLATRSSILLLTTGWPGHLDQSPELRAVMDAAGEQLTRVTVDSGELGGPFPPGAGLQALDGGELGALLRHYHPGVVPETADLLVRRYPNPLALELFCQIPGVRRRFADRPLQLTQQELDRLPSSIRDLYRQLWKELPEEVRHGLALATLGIPSVLSPQTGNSHWWNWDLLADVVRGLDLPDAAAVADSLAHAPTAYAWARTVTETLRQFSEPDQLVVAGEERDEFLLPWESDDIKNALAAGAVERLRAGSPEPEETEHVARLVLALHAEGFVTSGAVVGEAAMALLELLRDQPRELEEKVRLARSALAVVEPSTRLCLDLRRELGAALWQGGRAREAVRELATLRQDRVEMERQESRDSLLDGFHHAAALSFESPERTTGVLEELIPASAETLGEADELTLRLLNLRAVAALEAGEVADSVRLHSEVLERRREVLGAEHRDTLTSASNLANGLGQLGRYIEALGLAEETLRMRDRVLGASDPDTLLSRQEVAKFRGLMGDVVAAVRLRRDILDDKLEILGEGHPATIWAAEQLASALADSGAFSEALEVQGRVVAVLEEGQQGAHTLLGSRSLLADLTRRSGNPNRALALYEEVLRDTMLEYGSSHQETFRTRHLLAHARYQLVDLDQTIREFEELHADARGALDRGDVLAEIGANHAYMLGAAGRVAEARAIASKLWTWMREAPGSVAPGFARGVLIQLVDAHVADGRTDLALALLHDETEHLAGLLGERAEEVLRLRLAEAALSGRTEPAGAAEKLEVLTTGLVDRPAEHQLLTDARLLLADLLASSGEVGRAVQLLRDQLREQLLRLGPAHPEVARSLTELLRLSSQLPDPPRDVLEDCGAVIDGARTTLGPLSPNFRRLLSTVSLAVMGFEDTVKVLGWRAELVEILEAAPDADPIQLAEARVHLGYGLLLAEDADAALGRLVQALEVLATADPAGPLAVSGTRLAAIALRVLGRHGEAILMLEQRVGVLEDSGQHEEAESLRAEVGAIIAEQDGQGGGS